MASSEVDQKFLGRLAKAVESDNPVLASMLFKLLGLSINLSNQLIRARKQRRLDPTKSTPSMDLHLHIIWLSREGSSMLEQWVIPMVGGLVELKVLAYKLRASFYHIFVLFNNQPPVSTMGISTPDTITTATVPGLGGAQPTDDGQDVSREDGPSGPRTPGQATHKLEGGPVGPPPGFGPEPAATFLMATIDYLPLAHQAFKDAVRLAEELLWGSHSLRLSVKTEYAAFLYECVHDAEGSRKLARQTISEVYEATEGIDNDMFNDACELVTVLGKMMKRGLGSNNTLRSRGQASGSGSQGTPQMDAGSSLRTPTQPPITEGIAPSGFI